MTGPASGSIPLADLLQQLPTRPALGSRALFPTLQPAVYANHAAVSPASLGVQQAVQAYLSVHAAVGVGVVAPFAAQRERLRGRLAGLVGAQPADIALTAGTSAGLQAVAMSHPWRANDGVVVFPGEFPANVTPWQAAAKRFGLRIHEVPLAGFMDGSGDGLAQVEAALRAGAGLVATSLVQFQTGFRMPVNEMGALCRSYDAALSVDAIQACGVVPVDVAHIDYLACGGHKWLMGLEGCGFLYVAPERVPALRPLPVSWLSHEAPLGFLFDGPGHLRYDRNLRQRADVFEGSAPQGALFAGLEAGLMLIEDIGIDAIFAHVQRWHDGLEQGLLARGFSSLRAANPAGRSGSLSVHVPVDVNPVPFHAALGRQGISASLPDGCVRFSPHWPSALAEVDTVLAAVDHALHAQRAQMPR